MNNYVEEIINICKLPFDEIGHDFKVVFIGGKVIHICNFKKLIDYCDKKVVLKLKKDILEIGGDSLTIKQINKGEIVVSGEISSFVMGVSGEKKK